MKQQIQRWIRSAIRKSGFDIVHFAHNHPDFVLKKGFEAHAISTILDVGANRGQFASHAFDYGFNGVIHSFEPFPAAFGALRTAAQSRAKWQVHQIALSCTSGTASLNIGVNDQTCSLRSPLAGAADRIPDMTSAGHVDVKTTTLDEFLQTESIDPARCFLKLDVQGSERDVLEGARGSVGRIPLLQLETAITPTYEGEARLAEMIDYVHSIGMVVRAFRDVFANPHTSELMQVDLIAERTRR